MAEPTRFFMVHMRKAGGTALRARFKAIYGFDGIYPNGDDGGFMGLTDMHLLRQRWPERRRDIRVIMGHLPLCTVDMLDAEFVTLTMLRHPVERTLSFLRMQKARNPDDVDRSLDEVYDAQPRFDTTIDNHMTRMLGLGLDEALAGDGGLTVVDQDADLLARAKAGLERVDEIGLHEDYGDFVDRISRRYHLDLGDDERRNQVLPRNRVEHTDARARRIEADQQLDLELYEHARALVEQRR